jgi:hypothetical protein
MQYGYPSLTAAHGLGSYGRTGNALIISSPRNRIGSQSRIYAYYNERGQGELYKQYLSQHLINETTRGYGDQSNRLNDFLSNPFFVYNYYKRILKYG